MGKIDCRPLLRITIIGSLVGFGLACSSQSSVEGGDAKIKSPATVEKSSGSGSGKKASTEDEYVSEGAAVDLPQEIAGAFLTCNYVTAKESGFSPSTEKMPVGCVVQADGAKVDDNNFQFDIELYSPSKNVEDMETLPAPPTSKWHGYANLPMVGKTKHNLGMLITDKPSGTKYGPLLFPVSRLSSSSEEATFALVGNYVAAAVNNVESAFGTTNLETPVLPSSICTEGMVNESVDMSQYKDIVAVGGRVIGEIIGVITGNDKIVPSNKLNGTGRPTRAVECFGLAKEAGPSSFKTVISTQPVLEGAGCLFLQSKNGHVIYDQKTIETFNIKREFLETYVMNHQCGPTK